MRRSRSPLANELPRPGRGLRRDAVAAGQCSLHRARAGLEFNHNSRPRGPGQGNEPVIAGLHLPQSRRRTFRATVCSLVTAGRRAWPPGEGALK